MISELYVQKSFVLLGRSLQGCLGCKYCRLGDGSADNLVLEVLPGSINSEFRKLPVAVNLLYGDPTLQPEYTDKLLRLLEKDHHAGPVIVILKGDFWRLPNRQYDLDLHFAFSTFGIDHSLDGGSRAQFLKNLEASALRPWNRYSIEFRPIVYGVNDDPRTFEWVLDRAAEYGLAVGYSGLQGKPLVVDEWRRKGLLRVLQPVPGYSFGHKKVVEEQAETLLRSMAVAKNVPVFRKTSCLISHTHGLGRDYNAHYYRPTEVGCDSCPMEARCRSFKSRWKNDTGLPYKHWIVDKTDHVCVRKRKGICEFPTPDCSRISGLIIKTDVKLTTADVRVTKWLTGMTVDADFEESPYLSDFWAVNK